MQYFDRAHALFGIQRAQAHDFTLSDRLPLFYGSNFARRDLAISHAQQLCAFSVLGGPPEDGDVFDLSHRSYPSLRLLRAREWLLGFAHGYAAYVGQWAGDVQRPTHEPTTWLRPHGKAIPEASSMSAPTPEEIARFREVQQLAYRCASAIEADLRVGMTERLVARMMRRWLADHGVHEYFHVPFVWFGDRTSFSGDWSVLEFGPTNRKLQTGMPVILDVAPSLDGYAADVGYGCCLGENPSWEKLQLDLQAHRTLILELVKRRKTAREIYLAVDALAARHGYANRHRAYPGGVLAHRMLRMPETRLRRVVLGGFGLPALRDLGRAVHAARFGHHAEQWPFWNDKASSDVPVTPGLWAVEPHLGAGPVGSKWEEILVVTVNDAYWLDDDLPHVRRWNANANANARAHA